MNFFSTVFKSRRSSATSASSVSSAPAASVPADDASPPTYEAAISTPPVTVSTESSSAAASAPSNPSSRCLDLVFCVDCTGSMSSYISAAQQSMRDIVQKIVAAESVDIQCAIVSYRDWCDESSTYVVKAYPFESSLKKIQTNINELSAAGGGDAPEAVTAGLAEVNSLCYRKDSVRFCILIADAADHGLGESGDSLPNGDPKGRDPLQIARQLKEKNVAIYSVACEPALSNTRYGRDFFFTVARITGGRFLPLTSASLLADVVIGGAQEELSLQALEQSIAAEAEQVKAEAKKNKETLSETVIADRVAKNLASRGTKAHQIHFDGRYQNQDLRNVGLMESSESLASVRSKLKPSVWGDLVTADGKPIADASAPLHTSTSKSASRSPRRLMSNAHAKRKSLSKDEEEKETEAAAVAAPCPAPAGLLSSMSSLSHAAASPQKQKVHSEYAAISSEQVCRMLNRKK